MSYVRLAVCPTCGSTRQRVELGYAAAVSGREDEFPVLARALRNAKPAISPKIEWLAKGGTFFNYMQILRTPFGQHGSQMLYGHTPMEQLEEEALTQHLRDVEQALRFGRRGSPHGRDPGGEPIRTMGGIFEFLDREPRDEDTIQLRILRDLTLRPNVQSPDTDGVTHEWLGEISVQVIPG